MGERIGGGEHGQGRLEFGPPLVPPLDQTRYTFHLPFLSVGSTVGVATGPHGIGFAQALHVAIDRFTRTTRAVARGGTTRPRFLRGGGTRDGIRRGHLNRREQHKRHATATEKETRETEVTWSGNHHQQRTTNNATPHPPLHSLTTPLAFSKAIWDCLLQSKPDHPLAHKHSPFSSSQSPCPEQSPGQLIGVAATVTLVEANRVLLARGWALTVSRRRCCCCCFCCCCCVVLDSLSSTKDNKER